jgi:hypothetical protein
MKIIRFMVCAGLLIPAIFGYDVDQASASASTFTTLASEAQAAYIAEADTLCAAAQRHVHAVPPPTNLTEEVTALKRVTAILTSTLVELTELPPPAADAPLIRERFIHPHQSLVAALDALVTEAEAALQAHDETSVTAILEEVDTVLGSPEYQAAVRFAELYGFHECAGK